jgi:hypothetical protein
MDPKKIAMIAAVGGAVVALHGITNKKWSNAHKVLVILGIIGFLRGGGAAGALVPA